MLFPSMHKEMTSTLSCNIFSILDMLLAKSLSAMVMHARPHSTQTVARKITGKVLLSVYANCGGSGACLGGYS